MSLHNRNSHLLNKKFTLSKGCRTVDPQCMLQAAITGNLPPVILTKREISAGQNVIFVRGNRQETIITPEQNVSHVISGPSRKNSRGKWTLHYAKTKI
jgi:hypothetical protein